MIRLKRVYEKPAASDGQRILVERLWPRGLSKADAAIDLWLKDIAPSPELRTWFGHDPERWDEFCRRYWRELETHPEEVELLRHKVAEGTVTFVYAARDETHNSAVALRMFLERAPKKKKKKTGTTTQQVTGRSTAAKAKAKASRPSSSS